MAVAFKRGTTTGPSDLAITVRDTSNNLIDPFRIEYAVYDETTGLEVLMGSPVNTPVKMATGQYYAQVVIPAEANIGDWVIRWTVQEYASDPVYQSVQPFNVVGSNLIASFTGDVNLDGLIHSLRVLLRDNNPDRNYRFRPPASEKFIQGQTQVFGFIWEDEELLEYIYFGIDDFNTYPPVTGIEVSNLWGSERRWRGAVLMRAVWYAYRAIATNWVADEFSVGGEELITLRLPSNKEITLSFEALYDAIFLSLTNELRGAFLDRELRIRSLNKFTGRLEWRAVSNIMRHEALSKRIFNVILEDGKNVVVTEDHSLIGFPSFNERGAQDLMPGDFISIVNNEGVTGSAVRELQQIESRKYMYDISVPGNENFLLTSGIIAHNSYSISGVSLDIEKSSKYQSLKDETGAEWDKLVEAAKQSIKIIKGLRQFRYGVGITSALGPLSRPGVQSRRNMLDSTLGPGYV